MCEANASARTAGRYGKFFAVVGADRALMPFAGPAVVVSVAYMDPGNFATNIEAEAKYGYDLLWVVLVAPVRERTSRRVAPCCA